MAPRWGSERCTTPPLPAGSVLAGAAELLGALTHARGAHAAAPGTRRPSSRTSTSRWPVPMRHEILAWVARAWRTTLVNASVAIRYAATSSAAGRGSARSASTVTSRGAAVGPRHGLGGANLAGRARARARRRQRGADRPRGGGPRDGRRAGRTVPMHQQGAASSGRERRCWRRRLPRAPRR